ncbi:alpha/beta fold hydrolase [Cryptosporangium sp. NPDC048952]|uniref:alpha/beta fold hydrolase n=1 Tax=Cryptosporangium sp. NPDC048952 TaxID=3363961 RepID=UPI00371C74F3
MTSYLLLHGGGGPATMTGFADLLAERTSARVDVPTHPGFSGTTRPDSLSSTRDLAAHYVAHLEEDTVVIGNSFGGWLAAEIALSNSPHVSGVVIVDGIGIDVEGHPVTNVRGLAPAQIQQLSWHDPCKAPPAGKPDVEALLAYTGPTMSDPTLRDRLADVDVDVHVVWGESDGIVDIEYGKAYANAIGQSTFTVLPETGHLPQVETPEELLNSVLGRTMGRHSR